MRYHWLPLGAALALAGAIARGDVEELFSRHVRVLRPRGAFTGRVIKLTPPEGEDWRDVVDDATGYRLKLPAAAQVETKREETRVLRAVLEDTPARPRPVLRIDTFPPAPGEPAVANRSYAERYAEQYPQTFGGKFAVTDSALVELPKKQRLALVGGTYGEGANRGYRVQWTHLRKDRHVVFTFDCAETEWPKYEDTVGRILLSLALPPASGK